MDLQVWVHCCGNSCHDSLKGIMKPLENAGVVVSQLDLNAPSGPGVLIFDQINAELFEFLRAVGSGKCERILALALHKSSNAENQLWKLLAAGASEVLTWNQPGNTADHMVARLRRWAEIDQILNSDTVATKMVGQGFVWKSLLRRIIEIARFTEASVLLVGESGTGKELAARLIHKLDPRPQKKDMVVVDCTTIVPELSGSEFFGHERGAFTGAILQREGAFELANDGTLFLDEVGDLPIRLQAQILRAVQERTYKRVGSNSWRKTNFRLLSATNRDLLDEVEKGAFRADLYYRITGWICRMPSLDERREDILNLVYHFLNEFKTDHMSVAMEKPVQDFLLTRKYPGNVRELRQLVKRINHRHVGSGPITVGDIPPEDRPAVDFAYDVWQDHHFENCIRRALAMDITLPEIGEAAKETAIRNAVSEENGSLPRAAQKLGVNARTLQKRLKNNTEISKGRDRKS